MPRSTRKTCRGSPRSCTTQTDLYVPELSFVAEDDGAVVGHVMNTWNWIEETGERVLQLSPLGVLPAHQRQGHGSGLVRASLDAVRAAGEPLLLVEGAPAYYGRFGFVRADELGLLPPPEALYDWAFQVAVLDQERCCRRAASSTRRRSGTERARARAGRAAR